MIDIKSLSDYYDIEMNEGEDIVEFLDRYEKKYKEIRFLKLLSLYINRV